jgi:branched-chain amino acid transport system substrate-binding protein
VVVAAPLSLSGRFALQGGQALEGLRLWTEQVDAQGGLLVAEAGRRPTRLVVLDDQSRRQAVVEATQRLIDEHRPDLLFGPYSSVLTLAAASLAERHRIVLWNHGGSTEALGQTGLPYLIDLLTPAGGYFRAVLEAALDSAPTIRRLALARGARGTFPSSVAAGVRAQTATLGLEVVFDGEYPAAPEGWPALVERLAEGRPEVVLGVGTTEDDVAFAGAIARRRLRARLITLVAAPLAHFSAALGSAAEGIAGPSQWEVAGEQQPDFGPTARQFGAAYQSRFGRPPDYPAAQAYAAGLVAARCLELVGTGDQERLRAAAGALDAATFYGRFRLDPASGRQVGHQMMVVQWQDGRKQVVWPPAVAQARLRLGPPS